MYDPYKDFEMTILENGLTVYNLYQKGKPWQKNGIVVLAGSSSEKKGENGLAHFVEHLINENARKDMKEIFENAGGSINLGSTSFFSTNFGFSCPIEADYFSKFLKIIGKMILMSKLNKGIEKQRKIILEEYKRNFYSKIFTNLEKKENEILYFHNPDFFLRLATSSLGTKKSIQQLTSKKLKQYYQEKYVPQNIIFISIGGLSKEDLINYLKESPFGLKRQGERSSIIKDIPSFEPLPTKRQQTFYIGKYAQSEKNSPIGAYLTKTKIPFVNLQTVKAVNILSEMLNYLLNEIVREKKNVTYHIGTHYQFYGTFWEFSIECDSLNKKYLDKIEDAINKTIKEIPKKRKLFEKEKERWLLSYKTVELTAEMMAEKCIDDLIYWGRIITLEENLLLIKNLKFKNVLDLLKYFSEKYRYTLFKRP